MKPPNRTAELVGALLVLLLLLSAGPTLIALFHAAVPLVIAVGAVVVVVRLIWVFTNRF
jgi:hypothetical protein